MKYLALGALLKRLKAVPRLMEDRSVSFWKKALVVFGIIYLVLPMDLIPPIIPVFGFLDDIVLWAFILVHLKDELDKYAVPQEGGSGADKYSGRDILEADYTVEDRKDGQES